MLLEILLATAETTSTSISPIWTIIASIGSFCAGIAAAWSLIQNRRQMLEMQEQAEESKRPKLVPYLDMVQDKYKWLFLVIKNFGSEPAIVQSITPSIDWKTIGYTNGISPFKFVKDTILPSGYVTRAILCEDTFFKTLESHHKQFPNKAFQFDIQIQYTSLSGRSFKETFTINLSHAFLMYYPEYGPSLPTKDTAS